MMRLCHARCAGRHKLTKFKFLSPLPAGRFACRKRPIKGHKKPQDRIKHEQQKQRHHKQPDTGQIVHNTLKQIGTAVVCDKHQRYNADKVRNDGNRYDGSEKENDYESFLTSGMRRRRKPQSPTAQKWNSFQSRHP